jgi:hypothetical protein
MKMNHLNEQTHFGNGFSDGLNGKPHQQEFPGPEHAQKYHNGYVSGKERLNDRFREQKQTENNYVESGSSQ